MPVSSGWRNHTKAVRYSRLTGILLCIERTSGIEYPLFYTRISSSAESLAGITCVETALKIKIFVEGIDADVGGRGPDKGYDHGKGSYIFYFT